MADGRYPTKEEVIEGLKAWVDELWATVQTLSLNLARGNPPPTLDELQGILADLEDISQRISYMDWPDTITDGLLAGSGLSDLCDAVEQAIEQLEEDDQEGG
jgi:hypothetical protein